MDGSVSETGFDGVARVEGRGITDGFAIFEGDAVATLEEEGGVETPGFLLDELQAMLLCHQTTVEEKREMIL